MYKKQKRMNSESKGIIYFVSFIIFLLSSTNMKLFFCFSILVVALKICSPTFGWDTVIYGVFPVSCSLKVLKLISF